MGGDARHVLIVFPLVFFAIWWAWMNFTWFASAYDVDDVAYRLAVMVQMTGVLIMAAGIIRALEQWNFDLMVVGYVVMRLGMVSLWIRAAISDPGGRRSALRYAVGISLIQVGWVASLALPLAGRAPLYGALVVGEFGGADLRRGRGPYLVASRTYRQALSPLHHHCAGRDEQDERTS